MLTIRFSHDPRTAKGFLGSEHIQLIKDMANFVWGTQCRFGEVQVMEAPFSMFLLPLCLYDQFNIKLNYDRSTLSIDVPTQYG